MSSEKNFENWLRLANKDLKLAEIVYNAGEWLTTGFYCQQALEKLLTGLYVIYSGNNFPYSHNGKEILMKFNSYLTVEIPQNTFYFVEEISKYYNKYQYIDYEHELSMKLNKEKMMNILSTTKEVFSWLLTLKK
jgi:HEPN domain-containing protein